MFPSLKKYYLKTFKGPSKQTKLKTGTPAYQT